MNTVTLIGRLTKDPDVKTVGEGYQTCRFTIAVDSPVKTNTGEKKTDFISCVIWGNNALNLQKFVRKGHRLGVTGRLTTGSYKNQEGNTVYTTDVNVQHFDLLEPRQQTDPFQSTSNGPVFSNSGTNNGVFEFTEEDLPF